MWSWILLLVQLGFCLQRGCSTLLTPVTLFDEAQLININDAIKIKIFFIVFKLKLSNLAIIHI